jgi:protein subunit release factor A
VRNCVLLKHVPTGLHVRCQETRSLDGNRRIARRLLLQKLDDQLNGDLSKRNVKINKLRKKKANRRNKSKQKYASSADPDSDSSGSEEEEEEGEDDFDEYDEEDGVDVVEFDVEEHKFRPQKEK